MCLLNMDMMSCHESDEQTAGRWGERQTMEVWRSMTHKLTGAVRQTGQPTDRQTGSQVDSRRVDRQSDKQTDS